MNTNIEYIHDFLENVKDDSSLFERILDDIHDSERLNNGDDKHKVYYLQLSEDDNSGEKDFWVANVRHYFHLYVYAMLFNWKERWADDEIIKSRIETLQNNFSSEIASEIKKFNEKVTENVPPIVLSEIKFISDAFLWRCTKEVPHFTEGQIKEIDKYHSNYGRYITLINSDKQEDIAKDINKYLSYCMAIDEVYQNTDCLTSFIIHLSGTEDGEMDFETMLKTIPTDSWGIDNLRQILIKGEKIFPSEIIKMAIYSKHTVLNRSKHEEENINHNEIAKATLERFVRDFDILKKNLQSLDYFDQLCLTGFIRDMIVNNESIEFLCSADTDAATLRKETLSELKEFQLSIINTVLKDEQKIDTNLDCTVKDYSQAKKDLYNLAINELESSKPINEKKHPLLLKDVQFLSHIDHLSEVKENCSNGCYRILIMGEYQSGKTTFIDAINGKHIGAIGNGNTTSALPIEMSYAEESNVIPLLKNKEELTELLSPIQKYIEEFSVEKFDLDNTEERNSLYEKLNNLRYDSKCPEVKEPGLKVLAICSLMLKFYGDEKLKNIISGSIKLEHVAKLSSFPDRIETRWRKKGGDDFSLEESVFVFIRKFQCFIPSKNLKELNCTFVDSPGLFSNDYDTKITREEMKNANAILYLLPYDKEVGKDTCGSLYYLRNNFPNFLRKLFIVNNRSFCDKKRFYETNREVIKEMFGPAMNLPKVDARLAYFGTLKESFDNNYLSKDEMKEFILSCQNANEEEGTEDEIFENFIDAWIDSIYPYYGKQLRYGGKMPTSKDVIERSNLSSVLKDLLAFIEKNMVYSIIVSEGIHKLYNDLDSIKKSLILRYVKPYLIDKKKLDIEWDNRLNQVSTFLDSAKPIIKKHLFEAIDGTPSLNQRLSKYAYTSIFTKDSVDLMIVSICREIYNSKWSIARCGTNKEKIRNLIKPKINNLISNYIINEISNWNSLLLNGQNSIFSNIFITEIKLLEIELDSLWKNLFANDDDFISARNIYFEISKDTSKLALGIEENEEMGFSTGAVSLMKALLNDIAVLTAGILALLTPTILAVALAVTSNPIGWAVGGAAMILGGGYYAVTGDDWMETKFINSQAPKIKKKLSEQGLEKKLYEFVEKKMREKLENYESKLQINSKRMSDDRDVALNTPEEKKEKKCFASLKEIIDVNNYVSDYIKFCNQHLDYA